MILRSPLSNRNRNVIVMELNVYLKERKDLVETNLSKSIEDPAIPETLRRAMSYSLEAGGKRLRPILVMAGAETVGGSPDQVMSAAIAIEMVHTFSLIHDDLPAMDDDSLRRGKPTSHKVFGEAAAILAGDGLLIEAFYVLANMNDCSNPKALISVLRDLAGASGARGMTGGQVIDIDSTDRNIDEEELTNLHLLKTGALLRFSCTAGAKLSGANEDQIKALDNYGRDIGLAFQIADDILDIEGDQELLGKDVGSDQGNLKSTFPAIIGLDESKKRAAGLIERAISGLSIFDEGAKPLRLLANYMIERRS